MRAPILILAILFVASAMAQNKKRVELVMFSRYDQNNYTTRYFSRSYTNETKLSGVSYGLGINYIHSLHKNWHLTAGLAYYRIGIDKIRQITPFSTTAKTRSIDYRNYDSLFILFSTDKYYYNNIGLQVGFSYEKSLSKKTYFVTGADIGYLYTFSQSYHIPFYNHQYKTTDGNISGLSLNASVGLLQKIKKEKYYIHPKIILPVHQSFSGDEILGEDPGIRINKLFMGIGLSVAFGKYF